MDTYKRHVSISLYILLYHRKNIARLRIVTTMGELDEDEKNKNSIFQL